MTREPLYAVCRESSLAPSRNQINLFMYHPAFMRGDIDPLFTFPLVFLATKSKIYLNIGYSITLN